MNPAEFAAWVRNRPDYTPGTGVVLLAPDARSFAPAVAALLGAEVAGPWGDFVARPSGELVAGRSEPGQDGEPRLVVEWYDGWHAYAPDGTVTNWGRALPDGRDVTSARPAAGAGAGHPAPAWRWTFHPEKAGDEPATAVTEPAAHETDTPTDVPDASRPPSQDEPARSGAGAQSHTKDGGESAHDLGSRPEPATNGGRGSDAAPATTGEPAERPAGGDRLVVLGKVLSTDNAIVVSGQPRAMNPAEFVDWVKEQPGYAPGVPLVLLAEDARRFAPAVAPLLGAPVTAPWGDFVVLPSGDLAGGTLEPGQDGAPHLVAEPYDGWHTYAPDGSVTDVGPLLPDAKSLLNGGVTAEAESGHPLAFWRSPAGAKNAGEDHFPAVEPSPPVTETPAAPVDTGTARPSGEAAAPAERGDAADGSVTPADEATRPETTAESGRSPRAMPLSEVLPEELWWRLYLDPRHHATAVRRLPHDPGFLYDTETSPGFQQSMVDAYRAVLDAPAHERLTAAAYKRMHEMVTANLRERFDWTGRPVDGKAPPTMFPLRVTRPHPEVLTEKVGDRPLLVYPLDYIKLKVDGPKPEPVAVIEVHPSEVVIQTSYMQSDAPGLVDAVFHQYYEEIEAARSDHDRLRAIGRVVRNLQIVHPFGDGNRRLNVHLLLPKLLLEQGFKPVVRPDMAMLFQGGFSSDQIADALLESQDDDLTAPIAAQDGVRSSTTAPAEHAAGTGATGQDTELDDQAGAGLQPAGSAEVAAPDAVTLMADAMDFVPTLPDDLRDWLRARAGEIVDLDHEPLPPDTAATSAEGRLRQGVIDLVATQLFVDLESDDPDGAAIAMSAALADELGTRRRSSEGVEEDSGAPAAEVEGEGEQGPAAAPPAGVRRSARTRAPAPGQGRPGAGPPATASSSTAAGGSQASGERNEPDAGPGRTDGASIVASGAGSKRRAQGGDERPEAAKRPRTSDTASADDAVMADSAGSPAHGDQAPDTESWAAGVARRLEALPQDGPVAVLAAMSPELASLPRADREALAGDAEFIRRLQGSLHPVRFASVVAQLMISVPAGAERPATARWTAHTMITRLLAHNPDMAAKAITKGGRVVVIPRGEKITSLPHFARYAGKKTADGRPWDEVRGLYDRRVVALGEENILGEVGLVGGTYSSGYSSLTHEFTHLLHDLVLAGAEPRQVELGLSDQAKRSISAYFAAKKRAGAAVQWPDGPFTNPQRPGAVNYSATDEREYLAQLANVYLGTNAGLDLLTGLPRNNGAEWIRAHDEPMLEVLQRLFGPPGGVEGANPIRQTHAEDLAFLTFRFLMNPRALKRHTASPAPGAGPDSGAQAGPPPFDMERSMAVIRKDVPVVAGEFDAATGTIFFAGHAHDPEQTKVWITRHHTVTDKPAMVMASGAGTPGPAGAPSFADDLATRLGVPVIVVDPLTGVQTEHQPAAADGGTAKESDRRPAPEGQGTGRTPSDAGTVAPRGPRETHVAPPDTPALAPPADARPGDDQVDEDGGADATSPGLGRHGGGAGRRPSFAALWQWKRLRRGMPPTADRPGARAARPAPAGVADGAGHSTPAGEQDPASRAPAPRPPSAASTASTVSPASAASDGKPAAGMYFDAGDVWRHEAMEAMADLPAGDVLSSPPATSGPWAPATSERPGRKRVRWADQDAQETEEPPASPASAAPAGDQAASGAPFEDVLGRAQWHFTADGRPVLLSLTGAAAGEPALDERTIALLATLVPPQAVFVMGQVRDGHLMAGDTPVAPAVLTQVIAARAPDHQPFLLMPGSGKIAGTVADATGGPVLAAPHGVLPDFEAGTLRAAGSGKAPMLDPDGRPATGHFLLVLPREQGQPADERTVEPIGSVLVAPADAQPPADASGAGTSGTGTSGTGTSGGQPAPSVAGTKDSSTDGSQAGRKASDPAPAGRNGMTPATVDPMARSIGVPRAGLPYMPQLLAAVRQELAAKGATVPEDRMAALVQRLLSNYAYTLGDGTDDANTSGLMVPLGGAELLVTLDPSDPHTLSNPAGSTTGPSNLPAPDGEYAGNETINAAYATGAHVQTHSGQTEQTRAALAVSFGVGMAPGVPVLSVVRVGGSVSGTANQSNRSTSHIADAEGGHVEDARVDANLLAYRPNLSFKLRTAQTDGRTPAWETIKPIRIQDPGTENLLLWLPEPYLTEPPADRVTATGDGVENDKLPPHFYASGLTNLPKLFDEIVDTLASQGLNLKIGDVARDELLQKLWNLNTHLDKAVNDKDHGYYRFALHDKYGDPIAMVQVHSVRLLQGTRSVGATSDKVHLENVRTGIDGVSGGHSITNSSTVTPLGVEFDLVPPPLPDLGIGASVSAGYTSTNVDSLSAGKVGLWVMVPRYSGHTAAYKIEFVHQAKVWVRHPKKQPGFRTATNPVRGHALVRATEPEAFKYGLPIDRDALREEDRPTGGTLAYTPEALTTGPRVKDPATGRTAPAGAGTEAGTVPKDAKAGGDTQAKALPAYLYEGTGIGFGLVRVDEATVDRAREMITSVLRPMGFLPGDDEDPFADEHWYTHGNKIISRLDNQELLEKMVSLRGFDTHYDRMLQDGMTFTLHKRRGVAGIETDVDSVEVEIKATQRRDAPPKYLRTTDEYQLVNLPMGMDTAGMSTTHSRKLAVGFKFKALFKYLKAALFGVEAQRIVGATDAVTFINNQPDLLEQPGEALEAELTNDYRISLRFQHSGTTGKIAAGSRDTVLPPLENQKAIAHVLPIDEAEQPSPRHMSLPELLKAEKWTPAHVLDQGVVFHADTTGLTKAAASLLKDLVGPAGSGNQDVNAFAGLTAVRAHLKEIFNKEYSTDRPFDAGFLRNTFGALDISGDLGPSRFVGATSDVFVLGIIKLLLLESRISDAKSKGLTWDQLDAAVGDVAAQASLTGEFDVNRHWGWNSSQAGSRIGGKEYIQVDVKRAFIYHAPANFTVRGRQEKRAKLLPSSVTTHEPRHVNDRTVMYVLTEPEGLRWYADGTLPVSDAELTTSLTRWRDGDLRLTGDVVAGILTRWHTDLTARPEPPAGHLELVTGLARDLAKLHGVGGLRVLDPAARTGFTAAFGRPLHDPSDAGRDVEMPRDLVEYAGGERTLTDERLAEAMTAWQAGDLTLTGDVVANLLRRWATEVPDLPGVDRAGMATTLAGRHTQDVAPVRDEATRAAFNAAFGTTLPEPPVPFEELRLPEYLRRKDPGGRFSGHSGIHTFTHADGRSTYQIVKEQIDKVAPGLLSAGAQIWDRKGRVIGRMQGGVDALQGLLAKRRDQAMLDELLAENGLSLYLVNPVGWMLTDVVEVNLSLLLGDPQVRGFVPGTGNEVYLHGYHGTAKANSRDGSQAVTFAKLSVGGRQDTTGGGSGDMKAAEGHHRGTTRAESGVVEQTAYGSDQYIIGFGTELTVSARRLHMPHRPLNNLLNRVFDRWTRHSATSTVTQEGDLELQLPRVLAESGSADTAHPRPDFTPLPKLPGNAFIGGVVFDDTVKIGRDLLARMFPPGVVSRMFGATAGDPDTRSSLSLPVLLSQMHLAGHLREATGGDTYALPKDLFDPGDDSRRAALSLQGDFSGLEVLAPLKKGAGVGRYNKHQSGTTVSASTDHTRTIAESDVNVSGPMGDDGATNSWKPDSSSGRTTSADDASAGTENYRREQHGKEKGPLYLVRVRFRGRLVGDLTGHRLFGDPKTKGRFTSEPISGEAHLQLYQAQIDAMRAEMAEAGANVRPRLEPWPAMDAAPRFDLAPLLAQAAKDGREPGRAYQGVARYIRRRIGGDRPVVLTADEKALAAQTYQAVLAWGLRTMRADTTAARELDPAMDTPSALRRYELTPRVPAGSADAIRDATTAIITAVNEVHALRPDNPAGAPAELPPEAAAWELSPADVGRDVAQRLGAHVRVDVTGSDGTVRQTWISPDGRTYFFDPAQARYEPGTRGGALWVFDRTIARNRYFGSVMAERHGLVSPELRAQIDVHGLGHQEMGRLFLGAQVRQQTFEQAVRAELRDRAGRLADRHPALPELLPRAAAAHARWQGEADGLHRRQTGTDPYGMDLDLSERLHQAQGYAETAAELLDLLRATARGGSGAPAWTAQDVRSAAERLHRLDGLDLPARIDEPMPAEPDADGHDATDAAPQNGYKDTDPANRNDRETGPGTGETEATPQPASDEGEETKEASAPGQTAAGAGTTIPAGTDAAAQAAQFGPGASAGSAASAEIPSSFGGSGFSAGFAPPDLRPASSVPARNAHPFDPAAVRDWVGRVLRAGVGSIGFYRWERPSGPDPSEGWRIAETLGGITNDFARWIRGRGPVPDATGSLNCWEAFLFTAYWAGAVDKPWLEETHDHAARAGRAAYQSAIRDGRRDDDALDAGYTAYNAALNTRMTTGPATVQEFDEITREMTSDVPAGHLVFVNGGEHIMLALDTHDGNGDQEVLSHWWPASGDTDSDWDTDSSASTAVASAAPSAGAAGSPQGPPPARGVVPPNSLRRTTLRDVLQHFGSDAHVTSVAPAWSVPGTRSGTGTGGRPARVRTPGATVARPASRDWLDRRDTAPVTPVRTERLDPKTTFQSAAPQDRAWQTLIRTKVQRIQAANGTWVRNQTIVLPVEPMHGVTADDITTLETSLNRELDRYVNRGYALPKSKDQLHMEVKLVIDPGHPEAIELRPGRTRNAPDLDLDRPDARHWGLGDFLAELLHEVLHYAGLPDEYLDPLSLFRRVASRRVLYRPKRFKRLLLSRKVKASAVKNDGIMAGGPFDPSGKMPARYLEIIEAVVDATAVLRDHPLGAAAGSIPQGALPPEELYTVVGLRDEAPTHAAPPAPPAARANGTRGRAVTPEPAGHATPTRPDLTTPGPAESRPAGSGRAEARAALGIEPAVPASPASGDPVPAPPDDRRTGRRAGDAGPASAAPPADEPQARRGRRAPDAARDHAERPEPPDVAPDAAAAVDDAGLTAPQAAALERMALRAIHVLAAGDDVVHALQAVAPAETSVAADGRPASPAELRAYVTDALAADLDRSPRERRFWPLLDALLADPADDRRRAVLAELTVPDGTPENDALTLAAAAAVLALRVTVLRPGGDTARSGPASGRPVVLVRLAAPGAYTGVWCATGPVADDAPPPAAPAASPRRPARPGPAAVTSRMGRGGEHDGGAARPPASPRTTAPQRAATALPVANLGVDPFPES